MHRKYSKYKIWFINFFSFILWRKKERIKISIYSKKSDSFIALTLFNLSNCLPKACTFYFTLFIPISLCLPYMKYLSLRLALVGLSCLKLCTCTIVSYSKTIWVRFQLILVCIRYHQIQAFFFCTIIQVFTFSSDPDQFEQTYMVQEGN